VKDILKKTEKEGYIEILRYPCVTESGKQSRFMTEDKNQKVSVRWIG